jgi:hypothetical protein
MATAGIPGELAGYKRGRSHEPLNKRRTTTGWQPTCDCKNNDPVPAVVLDPFAGSGTTLAVAKELRRDFIGIELNPEYHKLIDKRVTPALENEEMRQVFDAFMADDD